MLAALAPFSIAIPQNSIEQRNEESLQMDNEQISLATSVKGKLVDSIIWTADSFPQDTRAKVVLEEPIYYNNGTIAIPDGSSVIVEVVNWNDAGFVTLNAIALLYENRHQQLIQIELEPQAFSIKNEDNRPLSYQQKTPGETSHFLGSVLGDVAETGARNILGRVGSSVSRTLRRNTRNSRRSRNSTVFLLEENTPLTLSINSLIDLKNSK